MEIVHYEASMRDDVLELFSEEYGMTSESFGKIFDALYEHPIQRERCIRLVAAENGTVAGFQSYMYWPYKSENGTHFKSFQSGNSIVGKNFRGKGVFTKLLRAIDSDSLQLDFDFMVGFPVEQSFGAFMKCGWKNPFNLEWHVTLNNPIASFFREPDLSSSGTWPLIPSGFKNESSGLFEMVYNATFDDYRSKLRPDCHHRFEFKVDGRTWIADCKSQRRGSKLTETIIGKITSDGQGRPSRTIVRLILQKIRAELKTTFVSIALPPGSEDMLPSRFFKTKKELRFIVKEGNLKLDSFDLDNFNLGRADVDTW